MGEDSTLDTIRGMATVNVQLVEKVINALESGKSLPRPETDKLEAYVMRATPEYHRENIALRLIQLRIDPEGALEFLYGLRDAMVMKEMPVGEYTH